MKLAIDTENENDVVLGLTILTQLSKGEKPTTTVATGKPAEEAPAPKPKTAKPTKTKPAPKPKTEAPAKQEPETAEAEEAPKATKVQVRAAIKKAVDSGHRDDVRATFDEFGVTGISGLTTGAYGDFIAKLEDAVNA